MSWLDRLLGREPEPPTARVGNPTGGILPNAAAMKPPRGLAGGRLTLDVAGQFLTGFPFLVAPAEPDLEWKLGSLDADTLSRMPASRLMELLVDLSPEVSRALWDWLRLCNPGWECTAYLPNSDQPFPRAQAALDAFWAGLGEHYGAADVPINRLFLGAFLRGGLIAELVLDETGRLPIDLATPDPASVRFLRQADPVRGTVYDLVQWQPGGWVPLDRATIGYVPLDPMPGVPYGRPMAAPALFTSLFLLGLLHDLRRVVAQQGYPRLDISINSELLLNFMPPEAKASPEARAAWVNATISEIQTALAGLQPEDAYVHLDIESMNRPVGTIDSSSLGAVDGLIQALERMAVRALKTSPFMMALSESNTETQANRQYEQHMQAIKAVQHLAEDLIARLMVVGLQAQGIAARVEHRFAENRASEQYRDEQTRQLRIANSGSEYLWGVIGMDEMAEKMVGHPADATEPRALPKADVAVAAGDTNPVDVQQATGTNRARPTETRAAASDGAVKISDADLDAADAFWRSVVPAEYADLLQAKATNGNGKGKH